MSRTDGLCREVDGITYGLCIEHIPGKKRPILSAYTSNEFSMARWKVAEVTDEDALREMMQGLFGGEWK